MNNLPNFEAWRNGTTMNSNWSGWHSGWGWALWLGVMLLLVSVVGNWIYTYHAHRKFRALYRRRNTFYILNERFSAGEITPAEYNRMKSAIADERTTASKMKSKKSA